MGVPPILEILASGRGIPQNEHLARALVAILVFLERDASGLAVPTLERLTHLLGGSVQGPSRPDYIHSLFECVAVVMKMAVPARLEEVEGIVLSFVQLTFERGVEDHLAYCFQVLGLLLDLTPADCTKGLYANLWSRLVAGEFWQATGNVPGLVRLLRAYFQKHYVFTGLLHSSSPQLIERFQFMLGHQKLGTCAFVLLNSMIKYLPFESYQQLMHGALSLGLARSQTKGMLDLRKEFVVSLSLFAHVNSDPATVVAAFEQIQPGQFVNFLMNVWLPTAPKAKPIQQRKVCVAGLVKLMHSRQICESKDALGACCETLARLLEVRDNPLLDLLAAFLVNRKERPIAGEDYEVAFNRLQHAEPGAAGEWDPLPEIKDVATTLASVRVALAPLRPAISSLGGVDEIISDLL